MDYFPKISFSLAKDLSMQKFLKVCTTNHHELNKHHIGQIEHTYPSIRILFWQNETIEPFP